MGTRTGNENPCVTQFGPNVLLPQGNYKVTFDIWPRGRGVQALLSVVRGGRPVLPPDGPGEVFIPANDGHGTTEYAYNFRVTAACSEPYEFVVKYLDGGGSPPAGYVQSWATRLEYLP
jgi:hypothetical protein